MALLWRSTCDGVTYEVRQAGASRRLYSNGVFHSQWNADRALADSLWDLLILPGFLPESRSRLNILVLGVGGGAVIRQALHLLPVDSVTGIELDPVHIDVANRWFGLEAEKRVKLVCADAREWLGANTDQRFDLVIDDLFGHFSDDVERSVVLNASWAKRLLSVACKDAVVVVNTPGDRSATTALQRLLLTAGGAKKSIGSAVGFTLSHPAYDNKILALHRQGDTTLRYWRKGWLSSLQASGMNAQQLAVAAEHLARARRWPSE